jgi:hypothetical protein
VVTPADELAHPPGAEPHWEEAWSFAFVAAGGLRGPNAVAVGGYARLALRPGERTAWWWSAVAGPDRPLVLVREHDVDLPRPRTFEVRASGLWAEPVCETPFEHWSIGLEAFAVALDDPVESYRLERGDRVPFGLDLEWEADGPPVLVAPDRQQGYAQACTVHGDVLVGSERIVVTGPGTRDHLWGPKDWWSAKPAPGWALGRLGDGALLASEASVSLDRRGLVETATAGGVTLDPVAHAPVQVPRPDGRVTRLARALCRTSGGARPEAWAWVDGLQPAWSSSG